MIQILSWNIRQGGGSRTGKIMKVLTDLRPDIIILSEFRNNHSGQFIRTALLKENYHFQAVSLGKSDTNSVLIVSRFPFNTKLFPKSDPEFYHNVICAEFDAFSVYGVYLPHKKKHLLFNLLIDEVDNSSKPTIIAGDYNTGVNYVDQKGNSFWYTDELSTLTKKGMIDAFRHIHGDVKEYSWFSHQGNGYRYDHTYVDDDLLPIVTQCYYLHKVREENISDHAPMVLEIG